MKTIMPPASPSDSSGLQDPAVPAAVPTSAECKRASRTAAAPAAAWAAPRVPGAASASGYQTGQPLCLLWGATAPDAVDQLV